MWSNFKIGEPSRKHLKEGDVFAIDYEGLGHVMGRVIQPKAYPRGEIGLLAGSTLIYIYAGLRANNDLPPIEHLLASNLLIAPMLVDRSPWTLGGVETIGNVALTEGHTLETPCYCVMWGRHRDEPRYYNDSGTQIDEPIGPPELIGHLALANIRSIDLQVSRAIGLPDPPDVAAAAAQKGRHAIASAPDEFIDAVEVFHALGDDQVSLSLDVARPDVLALGERIFAKFPEAYMNGYNWEALVHHFVADREPELTKQIEMDPESELLSAHASYTSENVDAIEKLALHIRTMLTNESELVDFIENNRSDIQWD